MDNEWEDVAHPLWFLVLLDRSGKHVVNTPILGDKSQESTLYFPKKWSILAARTFFFAFVTSIILAARAEQNWIIYSPLSKFAIDRVKLVWFNRD